MKIEASLSLLVIRGMDSIFCVVCLSWFLLFPPTLSDPNEFDNFLFKKDLKKNSKISFNYRIVPQI